MRVFYIISYCFFPKIIMTKNVNKKNKFSGELPLSLFPPFFLDVASFFFLTKENHSLLVDTLKQLKPVPTKSPEDLRR